MVRVLALLPRSQASALVDREAFRTTFSDGGKLGVRGTMDFRSR